MQPPPPASLPAPPRRPVPAAAIIVLSGAALLLAGGRVGPPDPLHRRLRARGGTAWHDDVDRRPVAPCGSHKCFFPSLADPSRGYLVSAPSGAHRETTGTHPLDDAVRAYEYALGLEEELGVRHLLTDPPFEAEAPPGFADGLRVDDRPGRYDGAERLIVQPTATAPGGSVAVKCIELERLASQPVVRDMDAGARTTLLGELRRTVEVVAARPELLWDFQLMIDPRGRVYHLDFERASGGSGKGEMFQGEGEPIPIMGGCLCLEVAIDLVEGSLDEAELPAGKEEEQDKEEEKREKVRGSMGRRRRR